MEIDADDGRVAKRQKLANGVAKPQRPLGTSRVFAPYRTVGLVSPTAVPFTSVHLGKTTFQITTSVGRSLQTYDLRRGLNLVFITRPQTPEVITASAAWKDKVLAAWGGEGTTSGRGLWVFKRGRKDAELELPRGCEENIKQLCVFGSWIVGVCETQLLVWKSSTLEFYTSLRGISPIQFTSCVSSLPTFLNKIIVGRHDGSAEIWNVSSGKLVYTVLPPSTAYGAVTAIAPTPALSLVAIAFENGPLLIHDVRTDQTVIQLNAPTGVPATSISFRTDGIGAGSDGREPGVMATASTVTGDVTLWDLNNHGCKTGVLRAAHAQPTDSTPGGISKIEFLAGQSVLVSSGLDNSLKTWTFDETPFNPVPRILHERRGHGAPVSRLLFLPTASDGSDDTGKWLLAGSKDRSLWGWSLRRDGQSTELSQGSVSKKARKQGLLSGDREFQDLKCPPITSIACSLNRDGGIGALPGKHPIWQSSGKGKQVSAEVSAMTGWESVLTAHDNDRKARTWFWGRKRAGRWAFDTGDGGNVTAVAMSPCGTFGLIGSEKGGLDMYNLQSGIHRQRFPARLTLLQAKQLRLDVSKHGLVEENDGKTKFYRGQGKHGLAVVGLAVDSLNTTVVSAGADGKIKFWNFTNGLLRDQIDWSGSTDLIAMRLHRGTDLAAFTCTDGAIRVVDISTQKLIRELWPCREPIAELQNMQFSDFTFSEDGHWIGACAKQNVFLWDLPTGHLIDAFKLQATCTGLAFSPTGEHLATASANSVGVDIWTNRSMFTHVPSRHISAEELAQILRSDNILAPTASGENAQLVLTDMPGTGPVEDNFDNATLLTSGQLDATLDHLSTDLLSLSLVPKPRWQNLLHLDLIRQRNKPIEPPKKPEKAPFFLPALQEQSTGAPVQRKVSDTQKASQTTSNDTSRYLANSQAQIQSRFTVLLASSAQTGEFTPFIEHLKTLPPAAADLEIRSLHSSSPASPDDGANEHILFISALTSLLHAKCDFELIQAWMAVWLRIHGDMVVFDEGVKQALAKWRAALEQERRRVQQRAAYVAGVASYLRASRV